MLTERGVIEELLARKLLDTAALVDGAITVTDSSRRNHNRRVTVTSGPSYFLKQGVEADRVATLTREAALYGAIHTREEARAVSALAPHVYDFDSEKALLILEHVAEARTMWDLYTEKGRFRSDISSATGRALADVHSLKPSSDWGEAGAVAPRPWVLSLHRPSLQLFGAFSAANLQIIEIVQRFPDFGKRLEELRSEWRQEALIHGDFKWDNCLVPVELGRSTRPALKIVDWELAGIGDPAWDTGSAFSAYLSFWVFSMPAVTGVSPERSVELARFPLKHMQPSIRRLWSAYKKRRGLDSAAADVALLRATQYCAARMVQTAVEQTRIAAQLMGNVIYLLQLAMNMLQRPELAIGPLFGIGGEKGVEG